MAVFDPDNKLWQSPLEQLSDEEKSPGQLILDAITRHGSKLAQVF